MSLSVSLSTSACLRLFSFSSASSIFLTRFCSTASFRFRSRSSASACSLSRAVSASISHWLRGSVGGIRLSRCETGTVTRGFAGDEAFFRGLTGIVDRPPYNPSIAAAGLGEVEAERAPEVWEILNACSICPKYTSRMTTALSKRTTSNPFRSSISTLCKFGSYNVTSFNAWKMATVMSGSLFLLLLPSAFVVFPERKQARSLVNLLSFFHLNPILGVSSEAAGSFRVLSMDEVDGCRKLCCGISNSQEGAEPHDPGFCLTFTC